ncbi:FAD/FMN-containing dehydrogenase [Tibeticola sediminis]|uniref:FAD/FMN-containing dehydrogenase n=1 Tax=Tibeticola sediminis TaxID=1917811 RepID=A0A3N4U352_9BURK|nr:FAD-binding oxidoreductase [Tibeticola sediminis]RPE64912.1 FAD/FMN-containing dehydrogenase [Tibeticola sediminis]
MNLPSDPATRELLDTLRHIVGAAQVYTDGDLTAFERDWRGRVRGRALAVVRPGTTDEVAAVVRACRAAQAATGVSLVPQGGNTGLSVGGVPDASGRQIVLSLQRMTAVRALDAANASLTVEAGCPLQHVQEAAEDAGFLFPLSLASEGSCTIGGNLATNAGGTQVLRYGNARALCLGLEVVTAAGEVWQGLSGLRKNNTGYDLRDLFVGSEGTLGIITAATLALFPLPAARITAWASVPTFDAAVALLGRARQGLDAGLTAFELMSSFALGLVERHFPQLEVPLSGSAPWFVLLELSDAESETHAAARFEALLEPALAEGCVLDAVVAGNLNQSRHLWHLRESIPLAQAQEGLNVKHDIAVPISRMADFIMETDAELAAAYPGVRFVVFGHLGDGNLHYNVQAPEGSDPAEFLARHEADINHRVYEAVQRHGGSISAEHGIGALKVDLLPRYQSPVALELMRAIKRALDPTGLLNPGRVVRD